MGIRDIIFRGKRVDTGEWVYGNLNYGTIEIENIKDSYYISDFNVNLWDKKFYPVIPETVGQYTGLNANGNKIFEGDILFVTYNSPLFDGYNYEVISYSGRVVYNGNLCMYFCIENENRSDALCALNSGEIKVIGNIHDNPELLEVK